MDTVALPPQRTTGQYLCIMIHICRWLLLWHRNSIWGRASHTHAFKLNTVLFHWTPLTCADFIRQWQPCSRITNKFKNCSTRCIHYLLQRIILLNSATLNFVWFSCPLVSVDVFDILVTTRLTVMRSTLCVLQLLSLKLNKMKTFNKTALAMQCHTCFSACCYVLLNYCMLTHILRTTTHKSTTGTSSMPCNVNTSEMIAALATWHGSIAW